FCMTFFFFFLCWSVVLIKCSCMWLRKKHTINPAFSWTFLVFSQVYICIKSTFCTTTEDMYYTFSKLQVAEKID
ncbi:hypothetical protein NDU88_005013, partial [Pleurodeles waltl]